MTGSPAQALDGLMEHKFNAIAVGNGSTDNTLSSREATPLPSWQPHQYQPKVSFIHNPKK